MGKSIKLQTICILFCFALTIGLEFLYRDTLFSISLDFTKALQDWGGTPADLLFRSISEFGSLPVFLPMYLVLFLFFPLTKSYTYITVFATVSFTTNIMKVFYAAPRPFWIDNSLLRSCSSGYGNPSGHSSESFAVYLTFWRIVTGTEFFQHRKVLKYILLTSFIMMVGFIIFSRVYLGSHSLNQILYGSTLGILFYFLYVEVLRLHEIDSKPFFAFFRNIRYTAYITALYTTVISILVLAYLFRSSDTADYDTILTTICPNMSSVNKFNNDGLVKGLILGLHVGAHYGLILLSRVVDDKYNGKEEFIDTWNNTGWGNFKPHILRSLIIAGCSIIGLLYLIVPSNNTLLVVCLFKMFLPLAICTFNIYFFAIYLCIRVNLANPKIYPSDYLMAETSSTNTVDPKIVLNIN
jgi:membrane-associated phospholipid phosphatase